MCARLLAVVHSECNILQFTEFKEDLLNFVLPLRPSTRFISF